MEMIKMLIIISITFLIQISCSSDINVSKESKSPVKSFTNKEMYATFNSTKITKKEIGIIMENGIELNELSVIDIIEFSKKVENIDTNFFRGYYYSINEIEVSGLIPCIIYLFGQDMCSAYYILVNHDGEIESQLEVYNETCLGPKEVGNLVEWCRTKESYFIDNKIKVIEKSVFSEDYVVESKAYQDSVSKTYSILDWNVKFVSEDSLRVFGYLSDF